MFNPIPLVTLGAIAFGYSAAIDNVDTVFDTVENPVVSSFAAAPGLSVQEFVGRLPETVQDPLCDGHAAIVTSLSRDFEETLESSWDQGPMSGAQLWTSELMGTWTLLSVGPNDLTCIVSSGFGWSEGMDAATIVQDRPLS